MPAKSDPREKAATTYFYRRSMSARDLAPAIGAGIAVGALVFYVAKLYLERTPLTVEGLDAGLRKKAVRRASGA